MTTGDEHSVGVSLTVGSSEAFSAFFQAKVTASDTWTWSYSQTTGTSVASSQSASLTITGPAFGYTGPISDINVYFDKLYSTFLFVPASPQSLKATGVLRDTLGQPFAHQDLTLLSNGVTYRTVTRNDGTYRFYGVPAGAATVSTAGGAWSMAIGTATITQDLAMPSCDVNACRADCDEEAAGCRLSCGRNAGCFAACNAERLACRNACCQ
jgi:hypothetical protein